MALDRGGDIDCRLIKRTLCFRERETNRAVNFTGRVALDSQKVAIVGLGYVGLTLAVAMAQRGMTVFGIERRENVVALTNAGTPHFSEEGLGDVLAAVVARGQLRAATSFADIPACDSYIITVGTPLDANGVPRLDMVRHAAAEVAGHIQGDALVVLRSTVQIGTTRDVVAKVLEDAGRRALVAMCPERTLEGDALREIGALPQIVGGLNEEATIRASALFGALTSSVVRVSAPETAEMIKLIDNTFRDVRFAFANEVARACDAIGINAVEVIESGKLGYARTNVALPGLVGGPCLEKDPHILRHSLGLRGIDLEIAGASRRVNERQPQETVRQAFALFERRAGRRPIRVALAGLAFKGVPETDDLRGSMALAVISAIRAEGYSAPLAVFDAVVSDANVRALDLHLSPAGSLVEAADDADILFVANNHPAYRRTMFEHIADRLAPDGFIYDYWNHFGHEGPTVLKQRYFTVGGLAGWKA
ncbi:nucleotide sugar dehydrogenase [uncultured Sphingomonas sp.]|uniref:nucleotide sugar dehydrogenase n=1 Tax=uncultured Sphingomonas sp. TaxID=158754 RepID=UPI0026303B74|nr:nucleotide sugar dehydrogenase [uncultured Sphingomonas sp.]